MQQLIMSEWWKELVKEMTKIKAGIEKEIVSNVELTLEENNTKKAAVIVYDEIINMPKQLIDCWDIDIMEDEE